MLRALYLQRQSTTGPECPPGTLDLPGGPVESKSTLRGVPGQISCRQPHSGKVDPFEQAADTAMNTVFESPPGPEGPSAAARSMIDRLIAFHTVSRDSNLGLIEWVRDYLHGHGAKTRLTYDATGAKANLFATLGDSKKPGLILSGHTDVVPVEGQAWETDPFVATERNGKLYARGSADMKGFI